MVATSSEISWAAANKNRRDYDGSNVPRARQLLPANPPKPGLLALLRDPPEPRPTRRGGRTPSGLTAGI